MIDKCVLPDTCQIKHRIYPRMCQTRTMDVNTRIRIISPHRHIHPFPHKSPHRHPTVYCPTSVYCVVKSTPWGLCNVRMDTRCRLVAPAVCGMRRRSYMRPYYDNCVMRFHESAHFFIHVWSAVRTDKQWRAHHCDLCLFWAKTCRSDDTRSVTNSIALKYCPRHLVPAAYCGHTLACVGSSESCAYGSSCGDSSTLPARAIISAGDLMVRGNSNYCPIINMCTSSLTQMSARCRFVRVRPISYLSAPHVSRLRFHSLLGEVRGMALADCHNSIAQDWLVISDGYQSQPSRNIVGRLICPIEATDRVGYSRSVARIIGPISTWESRDSHGIRPRFTSGSSAQGLLDFSPSAHPQI